MMLGRKWNPALWKVVWVVCPATYLIAIALFALVDYIVDHAGGKTTVIIGGAPVNTVTEEWFRYAWYQTVAVHSIAMAHATFCCFLVIRYRNRTSRAWFKALVLLLSFAYVAFVGFLAYQWLHPDPSLRPINDHF